MSNIDALGKALAAAGPKVLRDVAAFISMMWNVVAYVLECCGISEIC